jgi:hypothetical protein
MIRQRTDLVRPRTTRALILGFQLRVFVQGKIEESVYAQTQFAKLTHHGFAERIGKRPAGSTSSNIRKIHRMSSARLHPPLKDVILSDFHRSHLEREAVDLLPLLREPAKQSTADLSVKGW